MRISAFADCNSESVVLRLPYELAVIMIKNCPPSEEREEILYWLKIAARHSKKLTEHLSSEGLF